MNGEHIENKQQTILSTGLSTDLSTESGDENWQCDAIG
jgi:hypothetical protein